MIKYLMLLLLYLNTTLYAEEAITKQDSKKILSYLSSDALEGRGSGKEGNWKAAKFIAKQFKEHGLEPIEWVGWDGSGHFQHFDYQYGVREGLFRRRTVTVETVNVVGILRGSSNRCIVFGAHFDHLGIRGGRIYNGADDNASGTTALLELAEAFAKSGKKPKHTLVFVAFGAEEAGLIGSKYYANYPPLPLTNCDLMINMDMVGRLGSKNGEPSVGTSTLSLQSGNLSKKTTDLVHEVSHKYPFRFNFTPAGWRSDHAHFNSKGIPVLFFHTGNHPQYHQPTDDEHLINYSGLVQITNFIFEFTNKFME